MSITNCSSLIADIFKCLIGGLTFVLAGKLLLVVTAGIILHFGACLIVGTQKTQALLKGQNDRNLKHRSHVFYMVPVGVDPKEKLEVGLSEKSGSGFGTKEAEEKSHPKGE